MTGPDRREFSVRGGIHGRGYTLSIISTRSSASVWLSGGELLGVCSSRDIAEMVKGISGDSTPVFARSSGVIGGNSGERLSLSVGRVRDG